MADRATLLKDIKAKLKEWSNIIDELRAVGEKKLRSSSKDLVTHCDKIHIIHNNYLEAKQNWKN